MTRGSCDNKGGKRNVLRLIFYITAVLVVCGVVALAVWKSVENSRDNGLGNGLGNGADKITFVLNNGEEDIVCGTDDRVPKPSKQGYYLYGWYTDESLTKKIEFNSIADILGEENASKFDNGEYKLYAKWKELMNMTGVRMKDTFFIYDGICHEAEIEGLPEGASVEYLGDEEIIDAGEYEVAAIVRAYGYNDLRIEGKVTIRKAKVDVSKIRFAGKTYTWDGSKKRIEIEGELPNGVSVSYENNGQTEVGEYEIIAHFDCGKNYESIADMRAMLTIRAVSYEITFVEEDGTSRVVKITSGSEVDIPKPKEKRGYKGKWSIADFRNVHEDITVTAVYEIMVYKIEYEANGGELEENSETEYTVEDSVSLKGAVREYYDFLGWYYSPDLDGERIDEIPLDSVGDIKLYAKWEEKEYVVEYEVYGGYNNTQNENRGSVYVYTVSSEDL
ncbi:MAG: InlB B-repeat-containing protein, partial [Clostridia bacterium]|nr:InlB B-repeat-containing protein [Clostridia bacterium]